MVTTRTLPMGERAFLLEFASLDEVLTVHAALAASRPAGVVDLVPAARTVLVSVDPHELPVPAAHAWATAAAAGAERAASSDRALVELDIVYDGADLAETAALVGVTVDELIRRHSAAEWTVAFTGFAPGFGYLVSPDWPFEVPRLDSPRTRVPAGAVGLAGGFTGAYPRETPGGWRLIGTTRTRLFDADAAGPTGLAGPALLAPGMRVRFRPATARRTASTLPGTGDPADAGPSAADRPAYARTCDSGEAEKSLRETAVSEPAKWGTDAAGPPPAESPGIRIVEPGLLATLQDLGRRGAAAVGVAVSGALDRGALRTANRLLGNPEGAAAIEVTMGGFRAVATTDLWLAVTGAWGPVLLDGREIDPYQAHEWRAGSEVQLEWFAHGARAYVAVRGGFDGRRALGSRAADLLAGLGSGALRAGDALRVRRDAAAAIPVADLVPWSAPHDDELVIELAPGPRADWFAPAALEALFEAVWTVSNDADRVGVRLDGPELARTRLDELPSEGMVPGALQVPPSGRPTILLADGPVTGGYPVIAVVTDAALDLLAQARPGTRIRFRHVRPSG
ncbi:urea amidolyase family protein [Microbacterium sp. HD4P20]|uniref:5-oxoprolinase subunit B/C family protein n=1 Tax=Microbacterium sp. HD4P20 TaxID=2864874 RepID=UPI001C6407EE|nr:urea amidolyase family protein [Microbacterium sp. HD4P20]MCP2638026.1 urea amidolyase family protein [Microbacterium sp. HD4P20]